MAALCLALAPCRCEPPDGPAPLRDRTIAALPPIAVAAEEVAGAPEPDAGATPAGASGAAEAGPPAAPDDPPTLLVAPPASADAWDGALL